MLRQLMTADLTTETEIITFGPAGIDMVLFLWAITITVAFLCQALWAKMKVSHLEREIEHLKGTHLRKDDY